MGEAFITELPDCTTSFGHNGFRYYPQDRTILRELVQAYMRHGEEGFEYALVDAIKSGRVRLHDGESLKNGD